MRIVRLFQAVFLLALVPVTAYAAMVASNASAPVVPSAGKLASLSITSFHGNATKIGNSTAAPATEADIPPVAAPSQAAQSQSSSGLVSASVKIVSNIIHHNNGTIVFTVTGTSLTIHSTTGLETFNVVDGTGIFNKQSLVVIVHATVTMGSESNQLVLIGRATSTTGTITVGFASPQSKLAGSFFLSFDATLTIS